MSRSAGSYLFGCLALRSSGVREWSYHATVASHMQLPSVFPLYIGTLLSYSRRVHECIGDYENAESFALFSRTRLHRMMILVGYGLVVGIHPLLLCLEVEPMLNPVQFAILQNNNNNILWTEQCDSTFFTLECFCSRLLRFRVV